ncbi:hypothetical protein L1049_003785 [Liquidambar formosana]|uniref:Uncharacterized protein n=1 Tax=Liquidambar formosana TaxID=63359 RepID=A0AAP0RR89_LIQFO
MDDTTPPPPDDTAPPPMDDTAPPLPVEFYSPPARPSPVWLGVGIGMGGIILLVAVGVLIILRRRRKRRRRREHGLVTSSGIPPQGPKDDPLAGSPQHCQPNTPPPPDNIVAMMPKPTPPPGIALNTKLSPGRVFTSPATSSNLGSEKPPPSLSLGISLGFTKSAFTYEELAMATDGFSDANLLGQDDPLAGSPQHWQPNTPPPDNVVAMMPKPTPPPGIALNTRLSPGRVLTSPATSNNLGSKKPPPSLSPGISFGFTKSTFTYEELAMATDGVLEVIYSLDEKEGVGILSWDEKQGELMQKGRIDAKAEFVRIA